MSERKGVSPGGFSFGTSVSCGLKTLYLGERPERCPKCEGSLTWHSVTMSHGEKAYVIEVKCPSCRKSGMASIHRGTFEASPPIDDSILSDLIRSRIAEAMRDLGQNVLGSDCEPSVDQRLADMEARVDQLLRANEGHCSRLTRLEEAIAADVSKSAPAEPPLYLICARDPEHPFGDEEGRRFRQEIDRGRPGQVLLGKVPVDIFQRINGVWEHVGPGEREVEKSEAARIPIGKTESGVEIWAPEESPLKRVLLEGGDADKWKLEVRSGWDRIGWPHPLNGEIYYANTGRRTESGMEIWAVQESEGPTRKTVLLEGGHADKCDVVVRHDQKRVGWPGPTRGETWYRDTGRCTEFGMEIWAVEESPIPLRDPYTVGCPEFTPEQYARIEADLKAMNATAHKREVKVSMGDPIVAMWSQEIRDAFIAGNPIDEDGASDRAGIGLTGAFQWYPGDGHKIVKLEGGPHAGKIMRISSGRYIKKFESAGSKTFYSRTERRTRNGREIWAAESEPAKPVAIKSELETTVCPECRVTLSTGSPLGTQSVTMSLCQKCAAAKLATKPLDAIIADPIPVIRDEIEHFSADHADHAEPAADPKQETWRDRPSLF